MRCTWIAALVATAALRSALAATALDALVLVPEATVNLDLAVPPGPRAVLPREPVHYTPSGAVLVALGLPVGAAPSVRAFHQGADGSIYFSLSVPLTLSGTAFEPRDVIRWNGALHTRHFHGSARGVPAGVSIAAFAQDAGGADLLAFEQAFTLPTSGLAITRFDVVRWPTTGNPVLWLETDTVGASTAVLGIDGVSRLGNGRVLFSFAARGIVGGALRDDEDVLEYDPASGAWDLSVDSSDLDPDWSVAGVRDVYAELGPANVGVPDPVRLRMLEIDAGANPARYALRMVCGPHRVHDVSLGVIVSPNFKSSDLRIGRCWFDGCQHASPRFGPTVNVDSAAVDFSPDPATQRSDAVYVSLAGIGSAPLCSPGQDVLLAEVEIANNRSPFLPAPALTGEGAGPSHREGGALLPSELIAYESGSEAELWKVYVRPADGSGLLYEVLLDSTLRFNRLTAALIPPEGLEANQVSFGGCTVPGDPDVTQRLCIQATELGPYVDRGLSSTFGPDPRIGPLGGHPTALYLELHGSAPTGSRLPALNFSRKPIRLGLLRYAPNVVEKVPPSVLALGLGGLDPFNDCFTTDELTPTSGSIGGTGGSPGGDSDGDGQADDHDNCVGSISQSDSGGVGSNVPDGIGNDCQCGDVVDSAGSSPDGIIDQSDVVRIRRALVGAEAISPAAALKCNVQGAVDGTLSPLGLRKDCELRERVVLGRALAGQLGASPDLQKCAAP